MILYIKHYNIDMMSKPVEFAFESCEGCNAPPPNLPKGPLSDTKWAKNGVFVGRLRG